LHPAGQLVRRKSHNDGLYRVSRTQPFIVILHRNLAFFQTLCGAVPEYIGRRIEAVITGLTRNQAGTLEVVADFLTSYRQKSTVFYNQIFADAS
jgi:hypothetical protein